MLGLFVLRFFNKITQRDVSSKHHSWHQLGELFTRRVRHTQNSCGVLQGLLGLYGSKGDNLGHPVFAIFLADVANNFSPASIVKVNVNIWRRHAIRVQEPLENQTVNYWIELRNAKSVGNNRTSSRTSSRTNPNSLRPGPSDKVSHHEEIAGKSHLCNHSYFVVCLVSLQLWNVLAVASLHSPIYLFSKPACFCLPLR